MSSAARKLDLIIKMILLQNFVFTYETVTKYDCETTLNRLAPVPNHEHKQ